MALFRAAISATTLIAMTAKGIVAVNIITAITAIVTAINDTVRNAISKSINIPDFANYVNDVVNCNIVRQGISVATHT